MWTQDGVHIMWTHRMVSILCEHIGGCPYCVDTWEVSILCGHIGGCQYCVVT